MARERICLDTTFIIDFFKGKKETEEFLKNNYAELFITEITIFETISGIFETKSKKEFDEFMDFVSEIDVIPTTTMFAINAAEYSGRLRTKGITIGSMDLFIAGIMKNFGISKIVTRNTKHFQGMPGIKAISY